jgi:hypothetical protein
MGRAAIKGNLKELFFRIQAATLLKWQRMHD